MSYLDGGACFGEIAYLAITAVGERDVAADDACLLRVNEALLKNATGAARWSSSGCSSGR